MGMVFCLLEKGIFRCFFVKKGPERQKKRISKKK